MNDTRKKRVTIKDVAQLAGVAPSTVSFVLNGTKGQTISLETRERIFRCVEQLGYRPNYSASRIRSGSAKTIGVVATYKVNSLYFLDLINGIMEEANRAGYAVMICPPSGKESESPCLNYYLEGRIDGIVFISSAHSEEKSRECDYIALFCKHHIPFTVLYGYTDFPGVGYANTHFYEDGRRACSLLIERGCRRICYIGPLDKDNRSLYMPQTERDRIDGYADAMNAAGLPARVLHFPRDFHAGDYGALVQTVRDAGADGFVTCWATYGLQMLSLLRDAGLGVPGDVRVIALDSLPYLQHTSPPLSAMRMPFREMAQYGTRVLLKLLADGTYEPVSKRFDAILEIRGSV